MAVEFKGIAFEDVEVQVPTRFPEFHGVSFEDLQEALPERYPKFYGITFEDIQESRTDRYPEFSGFSIEDINVPAPTRFPQVISVSFEDFWLYDLQIKVQDIDGNAIPNANLRVRSFGSAYGFNMTTDQNGLATLRFRFGENHVLSIKREGYKTYRHHFNREIDMNWEQTLWPIIPIVLLPEGKTAKPLNPHEPVHEIYN